MRGAARAFVAILAREAGVMVSRDDAVNYLVELGLLLGSTVDVARPEEAAKLPSELTGQQLFDATSSLCTRLGISTDSVLAKLMTTVLCSRTPPAASSAGYTGAFLDASIFDLVARYEPALERSLIRALHELERLKARRLGAPVLAPIAVDVDVQPQFRTV